MIQCKLVYFGPVFECEVRFFFKLLVYMERIRLHKQPYES